MLAHLPSVDALESNDNGRIAVELRFARLRRQVAVIRALADHVEHLAWPDASDGLGEQIIEEMARLGRGLLEAAGSRTAATRPDDSGIFVRSSSRVL